MPVDDVWITPTPSEASIWWKLGSRCVCAVIMLLSKVWLRCMNTMTVYGEENFHEAIANRPPNRPLVTVANHTSVLDGPTIASLLRWRYLTNLPRNILWVPGAKEIIFTSRLNSLTMQLAQTVPVVRGEGVYQKPMNFLQDRINEGNWVHVFPEGKVNLDKTFIRLKWGVGRLVTEANICPLVVPIWHIGMDEVMPPGKPYTLQSGKKITIVIGDAIEFSEIVQQMKDQCKTKVEIRKYVTDRIQDAMMTLKTSCEAKHRLITDE